MAWRYRPLRCSTYSFVCFAPQAPAAIVGTAAARSQLSNESFNATSAGFAKSRFYLHKHAMIDHVSFPVRNLASATAFYDAVLTPLGMSRLVTRERTAGYGKRYPEFWVNVREDFPLTADPGAHVALRAKTENAVREFYQAALSNGGIDDGPPGLRQGELTAYFGAFIRDPDGNKIEVVTFPASAD